SPLTAAKVQPPSGRTTTSRAQALPFDVHDSVTSAKRPVPTPPSAAISCHPASESALPIVRVALALADKAPTVRRATCVTAAIKATTTTAAQATLSPYRLRKLPTACPLIYADESVGCGAQDGLGEPLRQG